MSSAVGVMLRLRGILPVKVRLLLYNSLVLSLLQYCCTVWGTTGVTNLSKLHLLQKRAVRCIAGVPYCSPTHDLFLKYEILPIYSLYNYRLLMIYKRSSHSHEHYISYLAKLQKNTHILQTRHKEIWLVPTPRAYYTEQSLSYTVPVLLNKLNRELFDPFQHSSDVIKRFFLRKIT